MKGRKQKKEMEKEGMNRLKNEVKKKEEGNGERGNEQIKE